MKFAISLLILFHLSATLQAQYEPQAGISGSNAVHKSSAQIVNWASHCDVQTGWMDIANTSLGKVSTGDSSCAVGVADNIVVSLGDSGVATLTFTNPIINGSGPDFAVFENGFLNTTNNEEAFLELAFVEVSSDGVDFFRFPATSLTQDTQQISGTGAPASGDYIDARQINNLAGKYISNYGTPFDLEELKNLQGLDVNHITHVRLTDVIGSLNAHASLDNDGRKINDPYPTPFPTCGFDLDAVAVMHQAINTSVENRLLQSVFVYPNPVSDYLFIESKNGKTIEATICDAQGRILIHTNEHYIDAHSFAKGMYYITIKEENGKQCTERFIKL